MTTLTYSSDCELERRKYKRAIRVHRNIWYALCGYGIFKVGYRAINVVCLEIFLYLKNLDLW